MKITIIPTVKTEITQTKIQPPQQATKPDEGATPFQQPTERKNEK